MPSERPARNAGDVATVNAAALGLGLELSGFIPISLLSQSRESLGEFERRIAAHNEAMVCYLMTGKSDYLIRVAIADCCAACSGCAHLLVSCHFFSNLSLSALKRTQRAATLASTFTPSTFLPAIIGPPHWA